MKVKMSTMIKSKKRAMIKGEMRMMEIMEKHHHIQECTTTLKEITPELQDHRIGHSSNDLYTVRRVARLGTSNTPELQNHCIVILT
jgi:hypothetical protein